MPAEGRLTNAEFTLGAAHVVIAVEHRGKSTPACPTSAMVAAHAPALREIGFVTACVSVHDSLRCLERWTL